MKVGILGSLGAAVAIAGLAGYLEQQVKIPRDIVRILILGGGGVTGFVALGRYAIGWWIDLGLKGRKREE